MSGRSSIVVDSEMGVTTNAELGNKEAAGSFTGEINVVTQAEPAGPGVVTEADWLDFVFLVKPPAGIECKAKPTTGAMITKERVPDCFIEKLKSRPVFSKLPPLCNESGIFDILTEARDICLAHMAQWNYLVDLHVDVLRQVEVEGKPFAEVGVDYTDGVKKIFILPRHLGSAS